MRPARPRPALVVAAALAFGTAVSLGLARFAYALLLPPMRADLGWSYLTAGAMNTVNAAGYLVGALVAPLAMRRLGARAAFVVATGATALALAAHGGVASDTALYVLRFATGLVSAPSLVAGAVLAASVGVSAGSGRGAPAGLVLGMYYGGTGIGIVAAALLVPMLVDPTRAHPWQAAWIGLGAAAALATALVALGSAGTRGRPAATAVTGKNANDTHEAIDSTRATSISSITTTTSASSASLANAPTAATARFRWRPFAPSLLAYLLFGLGYIGYMTFVVTLLRERELAASVVTAFFAMLGVAVIASSWIWAGMLQRFRGGESLAVLNALLAVATLLPLASAAWVSVFASGLLFGAVFLSLVTSTTALIRHNLAPPLWPAAISAFTVLFALGQIVGPALVGLVADRFGGLGAGLACSAAVLALGALAATRQKALAVPA
jgi:MFS family permease